MNEKEILGAFILANDIRIISQEEFEDVKKAIKKILEVKEHLEIEKSQLKADMRINYVNKTKIEEKLEICKKQYAFYNADTRQTKNIAKMYEMMIEFLIDLLMEE